MDQYKNNIFILRNIHKSNDDDLIDYSFKRILPKIFDFYKENRNNNLIIHNIDNTFKKYTPDLYKELLKLYSLTDLDKLIFRKKYNKTDYIIKLLKDKNIKLDNYRQEAKKILNIANIHNYSMYIDNIYLNKNRKIKKCFKCSKYHIDCI